MTLSAATVVVAAFMASPVAAAAPTGAAPMAISSSYAHVSRAPRLPLGARDLGATAADNQISGAVALAPRDPAALERAAAAVSNPTSPSYRHYIPKGTFGATYGPTAATIDAVKTVLNASHLKVTSVSSNGLLVHFSGTVGAAQTAFRTHLANFRLASGRTGTETTTPLSFPASIASQVTGVLGLDTLVRPTTSLKHATHPAAVKPATVAIKDVTGGPAPCAGATQAASEFGGLTNDQISHAYGVDGLYKAGDLGAGQTVAIYELEPYATSDVSTFDTCYFGKTKAAQMLSRLHTINVDGGGGSGPGSGESILDIEDVAAMAPDATINVYEAPNSTAGGMDEYDSIVAADTAQVVTSSWGFCELDEINLQPGYINVENDVFEQAALQGQTVLNSSGDAGSDECAYDSPAPAAPFISQSDPASQPFVLGVGGTTITNPANPPTEQVWNDGNIGGGSGGGPSAIWGAPSWQQPLITAADRSEVAAAVNSDGLVSCKQSPTDASLCREAPDVSAQADEYTGAITIYTSSFGGWTTEGGTSSSAPLWAGMLAEINATTGPASCQANGQLGFVDPSLYAVASIPADYHASFNDVTNGNNDVYALYGGEAFPAGPGFDMATGLGTPKVTGPNDAAGLATYLCGMLAPASPRPTITSLSSPTVSSVPSGSLTVNGTGFATAASVSIDAYAVPTADWSSNVGGTAITISPIPTAAQVGTASFGPQNGTGRAVVSVTDDAGATTALNAASTLLYVSGTADSPIPSVEGIAAYGGPQAGGNTVSVFGSGFTTTGPNQITGIKVGGVNATTFTVDSPSELSLTIPPYLPSGTTCAAGDTTPATDVCQAQVVVSNANGSSPQAQILAPYTGQDFEGVSGGVPLPACVTDATCEIVSAVSEYDYLPTPHITSVTTTTAGDPTTWASEEGTTIATVDGSGFDYLGIEYGNLGSPSIANNEDFSLLNIGPTEFQIVINPRERSHEPVISHLTIQTLAGLSNAAPISYAGVPTVNSVSPSAGPDTGGTHVRFVGTGLDGVGAADGGDLSFEYQAFDASTLELAHYTVASDTLITTTTPGNNPGAYTVQACTLTGCSEPSTRAQIDHSTFDFYQPGAPRVTSLTVKSGPASGGTRVIVHGVNLADAVRVTFGKAVAEAANAPEILTNGSSTSVDALAPPGRAGSKVNVRVVTIESRTTGGSASAISPADIYTYTASVAAPPRDVRATVHGTSVGVKWVAPASTGGHAILRYRVSAVAFAISNSKNAKKPPTVVVTTKSGSARSATVRGLRHGWTYTIRVRAVTSKGLGIAGSPNHDISIRPAP